MNFEECYQKNKVILMEGAVGEVTGHNPVCYMTNCVHPVILGKALSCPFNQTAAVRERFLGIQANASPMSPEELESGGDIIVSDYKELADGMIKLHRENNLKILGGCCGTEKGFNEL
ncbi:MAG: homocysteine S-methyltransferase family protein [Anaerocolumna sp.]